MDKPYFTIKKAQELTRIIPSRLTDDKLQKYIVKAKDYKGYIDHNDYKRLLEGGYFEGVLDPSASGVAPTDIWLQSNLSYSLDEALLERSRRNG